MFCPKCGNTIPDGSTTCEACGASIPGAESAPPDGGAYQPPVTSGANYPLGSISDAWNLVSKDLGEYILATLIVFAASCFITFVVRMIISLPASFFMASMMGRDGTPNPIALMFAAIVGVGNFFISAAISAPFHTGYAYFILRKVRGQRPALGDVFAGFTQFLVPSILAGIVVSLITSIGMLLCFIPGILAAIALMFVYFIIADGESQFMNAIMRSKDIVMTSFGNYILYGIVIFLVVAAGVIACGVGVLVSAPVAMAAVALVYEHSKGSTMSAYTS
jgi:hypothetical protein